MQIKRNAADLTTDEITKALRQTGNKDAAAKLLNVAIKPFRAEVAKRGLTHITSRRITQQVNEDNIEFKLEAQPGQKVSKSDAERYIKDLGLNPEEYSIEWIKKSEYEVMGKEGEVQTLTSQRVSAKKKTKLDKDLEVMQAGALKKITLKHPARTKQTQDSEIHVVCSDPHFPLHNRHLCEDVFNRFLRDIEPNSLRCLGDINDFENISKYLSTVSVHNNNPSECLEPAHEVMGSWAASCPKDTKLEWIHGNHDVRLPNLIISKVPQLMGLKRAGTNDEVLSLDYLLNIEQFGWKHITDPMGLYQHQVIEIAPRILAIHGDVARSKAGNTAHSYLMNDDYDVLLHGHDHRQAIVYRRSGSVQKTGVGTGTMGELVHSYKTALTTDAQNGFSVVRIWDDGRYEVSLATYRYGTLMWEGKRWS